MKKASDLQEYQNLELVPAPSEAVSEMLASLDVEKTKSATKVENLRSQSLTEQSHQARVYSHD